MKIIFTAHFLFIVSIASAGVLVSSDNKAHDSQKYGYRIENKNIQGDHKGYAVEHNKEYGFELKDNQYVGDGEHGFRNYGYVNKNEVMYGYKGLGYEAEKKEYGRREYEQ